MTDEKPLELIGGNVALDFVNTLSALDDGNRAYPELLRFLQLSGLLSARHSRSSLRTQDQAQCAKLVKAAARLRECLRSLFAAAVEERALPLASVAILNHYIAEAAAKRKLRPEGHGALWVWENDHSDSLAPLWPIIWSAAELLASTEHPALRRCAYESCGYFFLDSSKNQSRRWCDMKVCGNRAKARSHYQKKRATAQDGQL